MDRDAHPPPPKKMMWTNLPPELCDLVLWHVDEVERVAQTCRALRDAVHAHLDAHAVRVRVGDCVQRAIDAARPGATVHLDVGLHIVEAALHVHTRIRLSGPAGRDADLDDRAVLASPEHALLRTSATCARVERLVLCCLGRSLGHPASVVQGLSGTLFLCDCTVTSRAVINVYRMTQPVCGVWAGPFAHIELDQCTVLGCAGPGLRSHRGTIVARDCTVARTQRGANVVARGGQLCLLRCFVHGANGDGISLWSSVIATVESNVIFGNRASGISCHSEFVRIAHNTLHGNRNGSLFLGIPPDLENNLTVGDYAAGEE